MAEDKNYTVEIILKEGGKKETATANSKFELIAVITQLIYNDDELELEQIIINEIR